MSSQLNQDGGSSTIAFPSDEAMKHALGSFWVGQVEVWRGEKMLASADERPWRERRTQPRSVSR